MPRIDCIWVNGYYLENTIVAGTSGYMIIYGADLDGTTLVNAPPGVTVTSFQLYNNGGRIPNQINAFFQAASSAATGQYDVTVHTPNG